MLLQVLGLEVLRAHLEAREAGAQAAQPLAPALRLGRTRLPALRTRGTIDEPRADGAAQAPRPSPAHGTLR